jgi:hypothetical protein
MPKIPVKKWNQRRAKNLYWREIKTRTYPGIRIETPDTIAYQELVEQKRQERQLAESKGRIRPIL